MRSHRSALFLSWALAISPALAACSGAIASAPPDHDAPANDISPDAGTTGADAAQNGGGRACDPGFADCDGDAANGCEAQLASDVTNCNVCGHRCQGGACSDGACQPVVLASASGAYDVTLDATNVYFSAASSIYVVPKSGGNALVVDRGTGTIKSVATDGTFVYWTDDAGLVARTPKDGGVRFAYVTDGSPDAVAVYGGAVYWLDATFGGGSMDVDGTNAQSIAYSNGEILSTPHGSRLFADASGAYVAGTVYGRPGILAFQYNGKRVVNANAFGLTGDARALYWTDTTSMTVERIARDGTSHAVLATGLSRPAMLASDGENVYVADNGAGTIVAIPVGGGTARAIATGRNAPMGVAVDATAIYWTENGSGQVIKLAK